MNRGDGSDHRLEGISIMETTRRNFILAAAGGSLGALSVTADTNAIAAIHGGKQAGVIWKMYRKQVDVKGR
ncbi:MAG: hypothetical protein GXY83_33780 [Rhodopirellula sp.]|nr:hypothetical protein [Rhodopirellula sp.]